jgi:hypothetical protein
MSKRTTTRWYVGAWVVAVLAAIAMIATARSAAPQASSIPSAALIFEYAVLAIAGIVMLVMLIGALVKLGMQRAWGWFVAILVLHVVGTWWSRDRQRPSRLHRSKRPSRLTIPGIESCSTRWALGR